MSSLGAVRKVGQRLQSRFAVARRSILLFLLAAHPGLLEVSDLKRKRIRHAGVIQLPARRTDQ